MTINLHNLSGAQIQYILDFYLYSSLQPIILHSNVFDIQIAHMLFTAICNKKRKISALDKDKFINQTSLALCCTDKSKKFDIIKGLKLERKFVFLFIAGFLKEASSFNALYQEWLTCSSENEFIIDKKLSVIESSLGMNRGNIFVSLLQISENLEMAYTFRNSIVLNYHKLALQEAGKTVKQKGKTYSLTDLSQNILTSIIKAFDKYDSERGALTSYVKSWIQNAQTYENTTHGHQYGVAYTIPQSQRTKIAQNKSNAVNFAISLDALIQTEDEENNGLHEILVGEQSVEQKIVNEDEENVILSLVKKVDNTGIVRLYYNIDETFCKSELNQMRKTMWQQLGKRRP